MSEKKNVTVPTGGAVEAAADVVIAVMIAPETWRQAHG